MADAKHEELAESWVDFGSRSGTPVPSLFAEEYLRLLKEAQRESNCSSARQSLASSRIDSPKSPPNSPNTEPNTEDELKGIFINYCGNRVKQAQSDYNSLFPSLIPYSSKHSDTRSPPLSPSSGNYELELSKAILSQWASRPDQLPPTSWKFKHPSRQRTSIFHKDIFRLLIISNILSILLGAGVGIWIFRR